MLRMGFADGDFAEQALCDMAELALVLVSRGRTQ